MDILFGVIIGIIVLTILVVVHELGHALMAKKHGVVVEEFGVGFPPRAWARKIKQSLLGKNVTYSINWLPLGGFVKLQGENDSASGKGDYGSVSFWKKTQILLAGVVMNWLAAAVILSILAAIGMPRILENQFVVPSDVTVIREPVELLSVSEDMPAYKAGLRNGDAILRFDGSVVDNPASLTELAATNKGEQVEVIYNRDGVERSTRVTLRADNSDGKGYLGVSPIQQERLRSTWSAPIVGIGATAQMSWVTIQGLGDLLWNGLSGLAMKLSPDANVRSDANEKLAHVGDSVAGPVGIFGVIFPAAGKAGPLHVMLIAAIISLTLAVMNILPIPALDGGRWFVTAVFKLFKKPLNKELEERIHGTGFMILLGLIVLVTIADIGKF